MLIFCTCALLLGLGNLVQAQTLDSLYSKAGISFRGLSVVNNRLLWVSGNKGTVGRSTDGGKHFQWLVVKGYEQRDFRDIEAFDAVTAVILAVDSPGLILRTHDGGASWQEVYRDDRSGIFLDAFSFWRDKIGMAVGDPIGGKTVLVRTEDAGKTWKPLPEAELPLPDSGEACFASSGTNIKVMSKTRFVLVTGGRRSRALVQADGRGQWIDLPLAQGGTSTGANSLAAKGSYRKKNSRQLVVVGGDFMQDTVRTGNAAYSRDGGRSWQVPATAPWGYRSGVVYITGKKLITCGTSGVDISTDGGRNWRNISKTGYHVVQRAKDGRAVFLAGGGGRIARLRW